MWQPRGGTAFSFVAPFMAPWTCDSRTTRGSSQNLERASGSRSLFQGRVTITSACFQNILSP